MRRDRPLGLALAVALLLPAAWSTAGETQSAKPDVAGTDTSHLGMPGTPDEHLSRAAVYDQNAAGYRDEAATHRKMFSDYEKKQSSPTVQNRLGREAPWVTKMRKHCDAYIVQADKMAAEAARFAQFHRMRAAEMKGH